jgi:hypothetical protein
MRSELTELRDSDRLKLTLIRTSREPQYIDTELMTIFGCCEGMLKERKSSFFPLQT